jgi:hypothetical protein
MKKLIDMVPVRTEKEKIKNSLEIDIPIIELNIPVIEIDIPLEIINTEMDKSNNIIWELEK